MQTSALQPASDPKASRSLSRHPRRHLLQHVLVLVEVLEERRLTDELVLLAHLLAGLPGLSQLHLQGPEGGPHHLPVAEVLE